MTSEEIIAGMEALIARWRAEQTPDPIRVLPGASIQAALDAAVPGATIVLDAAGVYPGNLIIRKPVTLRTQMLDFAGRATPAHASHLARLTQTNGTPLVDIAPGVVDVNLSRLHVAVSNLSLNDIITIGHADNSQATLERVPRRILFDQMLIAGDPAFAAKRGIALHGADVTIQRSSIWEIKWQGDSQAICGWNGPGPYRIRDCYLEAAGENIMFGGADPVIPNLVPADIVVEDSVLTKQMAWRGRVWTVKNVFELKCARQVVVRRNLVENCWSGQGQGGGFAFMLTVQSQDGRNPEAIVEDVALHQNTVRNVGAGINLMGRPQVFPTIGHQSRDIRITQNGFTIPASFGVQGWFLFLSREPREVTVDRNTIESDGNAIVKHEGNPVQVFAFTNNLVPRCGDYGFTGNVNGTATHRGVGLQTYFPNSQVTGNALGSFPGASNLPGNLHVPTASMTLTDGYGTGEFASYGRPRE
jgi:hypothetical protein